MAGPQGRGRRGGLPPGELTDLWTRTNLQDKELAENNSAGIESPGYTPGPYSEDAEMLVMRFTDWYCDKARAYLAAHVD